MKLFLLRPKGYHGQDQIPALWKPWYDKTFGFVVRAESENDARALAQANGGDETRNTTGHCPAWLNPELSTCEELLPEGEAKIIIQDFAAA